jgi:hypothetical protein
MDIDVLALFQWEQKRLLLFNVKAVLQKGNERENAGGGRKHRGKRRRRESQALPKAASIKDRERRSRRWWSNSKNTSLWWRDSQLRHKIQAHRFK